VSIGFKSGNQLSIVYRPRLYEVHAQRSTGQSYISKKKNILPEFLTDSGAET
jgi:hypothetical protein